MHVSQPHEHRSRSRVVGPMIARSHTPSSRAANIISLFEKEFKKEFEKEQFKCGLQLA